MRKNFKYKILFTLGVLLFAGFSFNTFAEEAETPAENILTFSVLNSSDDARNISGTTRGDIGAATHYMGKKGVNTYVHGLRFGNVNLPSGSRVKSARLYLYSAGDVSSDNSPNLTFRAELAPDTPTFRLVNDTPESRHTTKSFVKYKPNLLEWSEQGFIANGIDVTALVSEVVTQPEWQGGNSIAIIEKPEIESNSYVSYSTFNRDPKRAPKLVIEFDTSGIQSIVDTYRNLQNIVALYKLEMNVKLSNIGKKEASTMAWIYPNSSGCKVENEIKDGRFVDYLKPEYFNVDANGNVNLLTEANSGCDGFSTQNLSIVKEYSDHVYITVSAREEGVKNFLETDWTVQYSTIDRLRNFVIENDVDGVELDFEGFGGWDAQTYRNYLGFVNELGDKFHAVGKKVMVDVPPIGSSLEQSYYKLRYEDIADLPVDYIVVMAYDYQYDYGSGKAIAPNQWVIDVVKSAQKNVDAERLVIGLPSYGYYGPVNSYSFEVTNSAVVKELVGDKTVTRDPYSYELISTDNGTSYVFQDAISLEKKRDLLESLDVKYISVWALGGGKWFDRN